MGQTTSQKLQARALELSLLKETCILQAEMKEEEARGLEYEAKQSVSEPDRLSELCSRWSLRKKEARLWQRRADMIHRVQEDVENTVVMHGFGVEVSKLNNLLGNVKIQSPEQLNKLLEKIEGQLTTEPLPETPQLDASVLLSRIQDEHGLTLLDNLPPLVNKISLGQDNLEERFKELTGRSV